MRVTRLTLGILFFTTASALTALANHTPQGYLSQFFEAEEFGINQECSNFDQVTNVTDSAAQNGRAARYPWNDCRTGYFSVSVNRTATQVHLRVRADATDAYQNHWTLYLGDTVCGTTGPMASTGNYSLVLVADCRLQVGTHHLTLWYNNPPGRGNVGFADYIELRSGLGCHSVVLGYDLGCVE